MNIRKLVIGMLLLMSLIACDPDGDRSVGECDSPFGIGAGTYERCEDGKE